MAGDASPIGLSAAARTLGDSTALDLLAALVAAAPTNLEDPVHGRWEKPNYPRTAERLVRTARSFGLSTRVFDPLIHGREPEELRGIPRPNVIVDLDTGSARRVLILAHYDVVPVPAEQLSRWKSPPHILTARADGRLYGRGSNDDLGSGVVASLLAMKRLADGPPPTRSVRLLLCCDEETGGGGGVDGLRAHDEELPENDPDRFLLGEVALIPDGSPHATAGSSGVSFLDATFDRPVPLPEVLDYGDALVALHRDLRLHRSVYPSPDWPDHGAPEPVITGRATVTQFDTRRGGPASARPSLVAAHAESDAANQIPEAVTLVIDGPADALEILSRDLAAAVSLPFHLSTEPHTGVRIRAGERAFQVVGQSAHGGYPHRGQNPVPAALALLRRAIASGWLDPSPQVEASFAVDLRLIPEADPAKGRAEALDLVEAWCSKHPTGARIAAPASRSRGGYALSVDDPNVVRLERLLRHNGGEAGIFGEYGGTDASSLAAVRTPQGRPLPAVVFGSMDRIAHIHEAEESVDPRLLAGVSETIRQFVLDG